MPSRLLKDIEGFYGILIFAHYLFALPVFLVTVIRYSTFHNSIECCWMSFIDEVTERKNATTPLERIIGKRLLHTFNLKYLHTFNLKYLHAFNLKYLLPLI